MTLISFLGLSTVLFCLGLYGILTRRNIISILMSVELLFASASLNFVAFNHYLHPEKLFGQAFALFILAIAAAEAVVGLSLILSIHRSKNGGIPS